MNPLNALRDAWFFFRTNFTHLLMLCLPWQLLEIVAQHLVEQQVAAAEAAYYGVLVGILFFPLYSAALILFIQARLNGEQPDKRALTAASLALWPRFVLLTAIGTLAIMLGASLFILPGIWLTVRLIFTDYLLVLHGLSPLQSIQRSLQLTRGHFWPLLACVLLLMAPVWIISLSVANLLGDAGGLLLDVLLGLCQLFTTLVMFRLFTLRTADEVA